MSDALFSLLPTALAKWQVTGVTPERVGNRHPLTAPFGSFAAASDGPFMLAVASDKLFADLSAAIGRPELPKDPRFATDPLRFRNRHALAAIIETWAAKRTAAEAVDVLDRAGIPASTVWDVEAAARSEQTAFRRLLTPLKHPALGILNLPEQPVHFSGSARGQAYLAPQLGADSDAILADKLAMTSECDRSPSGLRCDLSPRTRHRKKERRMDMKGSVFIVTGSATGVGSATVKHLSKRGANVVINYTRSRDEARKPPRLARRRGRRLRSSRRISLKMPPAAPLCRRRSGVGDGSTDW